MMNCKYKLNLTIAEIEIVNDIRLKSKVLKERQKAGAIYFRATNKDLETTSKNVGITKNAIVIHIKKFLEKGIDYITENNYKGNTSELDKYENVILTDFKKTPPNTIGEAIKRIEKLTGLKRSWTAVKRWLKKRAFLTKKQRAFQKEQTKKNKKNS